LIVFSMLYFCKLRGGGMIVKRFVSMMLFFAVTLLVFHDQMTSSFSSENSLTETSYASCKAYSKIDIHEQLHAHAISFDGGAINFTNFPSILISTNLHQTYDFITFNLPYRPPSA